MKTIIFDLDGTIALVDHRRHLVQGVDSPDWDAFNEACEFDEPNHALIDIMHMLDDQDDTIIRIFSGRSDKVIDKTIEWLKNHNVPYRTLTMRREDDHRPDEVIKEIWLKDFQAKGDNIVCTYDDRDRVVKMFRDNGIPCFQVNYGNF